MDEVVAEESYFLQHQQWFSERRLELSKVITSLSETSRKGGVYLVRDSLITTLGDTGLCAHANEHLKKSWNRISRGMQNCGISFQQIGQDGSHILTRLFRQHLENLGSKANRWRKLQIVASSYVSGLCTLSLSSYGEGDCKCFEDTLRRYLQTSVVNSC